MPIQSTSVTAEERHATQSVRTTLLTALGRLRTLTPTRERSFAIQKLQEATSWLVLDEVEINAQVSAGGRQ